MLIRLPNSRIAFLAFALALVAGCGTKPPANARQPSALTPVALEIERRGYHAKEFLIVPPTPWEILTFRMRSKRFFSFRANRPMQNASDMYYRFSLLEETYDSVDDARHRLANLHLASPDGPAEERDYLSTMRTGFRVGNVTYVLQTDASIFWDEVQRFAKELATATRGAELSRAIINAPPDKSLDAGGGSVLLNLLGAAKGALIRATASSKRSTPSLYNRAFGRFRR